MAGASKVLFVCEHSADPAAVRQVFAELEVAVVEATSAAGALKAAAACEFALTVIDTRSAAAQGCELAFNIRRDGVAGNTPIIFLTTDAWEQEHVAVASSMGAVDFLPAMPLEPEILQHKARVFLELVQAKGVLNANIERLEGENQLLRQQRESFVLEREHLMRLCTHDELTTLANRSLFDDRLHGAVQRAKHHDRRFALIYLDLDNFKAVNDRHGHAVGDEVLLVVGRRLAQVFRGSDTVARLGGDEFAALLENIDSPDTAMRAGEKMRRAVMAPIVLDSPRGAAAGRLRVTASAGIVIYPDDARRPEDLLELGDRAMYQAKRAGGGVRRASAAPRRSPLHLVDTGKFR